MQLVLNGILFCFILALCGVSYAVGYYFGYKKKIKPTPKELSTEEKERGKCRIRSDRIANCQKT